MAKKPRKFRILEVRWIDAESFPAGWYSENGIKESESLAVVSVGLEVESTDKHVALAVSFDKSNSNFGGAMRIPRCSITKVRVMGKVEA